MNRTQNRIINLIYIFVALTGIALLFWEKSENKSALLFGYSWRKLMLGLVIAIITSLVIYLTSIWNKSSSENYRLLFQVKSSFLKKTSLQRVFLYVLLAIFTLFILEVNHILHNPYDFRAPLILKAYGFIIYVESLIIIFCYRLLFIIISRLIFSLKTAESKSVFLRQLKEFLFFEIIFIYICFSFFLIFFENKIQFFDSFEKLIFWVAVTFTGLLFYEFFFSQKAIEGIKELWKTDKKYYLIYILSLVLILTVGHIAFGVNDDVYMMQIAAGWIDGVPDAHLVYTNIFIGSILSNLYQVAPGVRWYVYYLILTLSMTGFLILNLILYFCKNNKPVGFCVFIICFLPFIYRFTFTSISILVSLAGFGFLIKIFNKNLKRRIVKSLPAILLVVFGSLIRWDGMLLAGLIICPLFIYQLFFQKRFSIIFPFIVLLSLLGVTYYINQYDLGQNPRWQEYMQYNIQRGKIHGTPRLSPNRIDNAFWEKIGWKKSGYGLFEGWFFIDNEVFTIDSFTQINENYPVLLNDLDSFNEMFTSNLKNYKIEIFIFLILFFGITAQNQSSSKGYKRLVIISILFPLLMLVVLLLIARLPFYVFEPVFFYVDMLLAIYIFNSTKTSKITFWNYQLHLSNIFLIALMLQLIFLSKTDQENKNNAENYSMLVNFVEKNVELKNNPLIIYEGGSIRIESMSPFNATNFPYHALPVGWLINSPPYQNLLAQYEIKNPIFSILERPDIYVLGRAENSIIEYLWDVKGIKAQLLSTIDIPLVSYYTDHIELVRFRLEE